MKEMTTRADVMMTDEERAEMEAAALRPARSTPVGPTSTSTALGAVPGSPPGRPTSPTSGGRAASPPHPSSGLEIVSSAPERLQSPSASASASGTATPNPEAGAAATAAPGKDKKGRMKMTPEQKAKLKELDEERRKATEARYVVLLGFADCC